MGAGKFCWPLSVDFIDRGFLGATDATEHLI
jgi:hypothetical protein